MNVLITGANGQLGLSIRQAANEFPGLDLVYTDVEDLDITRLPDLEGFFREHPTDYLINCAAYTAVDKAEEEVHQASLINETAVRNLALCAGKYDFTLVHVSTDYVFNGQNFRPYTEEDRPEPAGTYGKSKLAGEKAVLEAGVRGIVVRTSWLYSEYGHNFAKTMLRLGAEKQEIRVVDDQVGTPTFAGHLARAILILVSQRYATSTTLHFSNEGVASWYDFAREIISMSGSACRVLPIPTEDYPLPAPRPYYSVLSKKKFRDTFHYPIPHWKEGLAEWYDKMKTGA
jgi:dTDP-4-dehydrorhamnose reductase